MSTRNIRDKIWQKAQWDTDYREDKAGKASLFAQGKRRYDRYVPSNPTSHKAPIETT